MRVPRNAPLSNFIRGKKTIMIYIKNIIKLHSLWQAELTVYFKIARISSIFIILALTGVFTGSVSGQSKRAKNYNYSLNTILKRTKKVMFAHTKKGSHPFTWENIKICILLLLTQSIFPISMEMAVRKMSYNILCMTKYDTNFVFQSILRVYRYVFVFTRQTYN